MRRGLTLPSDYPPDYPDLLVRCEHGDAVLDRIEVLIALRTPKKAMIANMGRRREYVQPRPLTEWPAEFVKKTRVPYTVRVDGWINGFDNRA